MPAKSIAAALPSIPPFRTDPTLGCRTNSPDLWFPDSTAAKAARPAKKICWDCPRRTECLRWALQTRQGHGIFGGLTPAERLNLQARRSET